MKSLRYGIVVLMLSVNAFAQSATESGVHIAYSEPLVALSFADNVRTDLRSTIEAGSATLSFEAFGREFDFALQPNRSLLDATAQLELESSIGIYRGSVAGIPNSWARIVVANGQPRGLFHDGNEVFAIEVNQAGESFAYRLSDLIIEPGALSCGHIAGSKNGAELFAAVQGEPAIQAAAAGPGAVSNIDIGMVADFEFTNANGSNTDAEIIARMNAVDGIFSDQLGVQLTVTRIDSFTDSNDPFSDEPNAGDLLDEVADYRFMTPEQNANGLTHLFTGRDLTGTTVGVAFSGALCSTRFGAGLTQGSTNVTLDTLVAAHEIGHNFGAPHDDESGSACESTPPDFLMAPQINGSNEFSACSITEMSDNVAAASCITPLAVSDINLLATNASQNILLGNSSSVTFNVNSGGAQDSTGVTFDATIPAALTLDNISSTIGTCSSGAGTVNCTIGTVTAGSGATVTIDVTPNAVGMAQIDASSGSANETNLNNNQASATIDIQAAVDVVSLPANANLNLNQSLTVRPVVENRATIAATNVVLIVTADAGLQIDSASWGIGSCNVASGVATCTGASLAAQSTATVDLQLTALAAGSQNYQMSVAADQPDTASANNDSSGLVNVTDPNAAPPDDGGGSGSFGVWMLLALLPVSFRRLRRAAR